MVCHLPEDPLNRHARFILTCAPPSAKSWFQQIRDLCSQYGLPTPLQQLDNPLPKEAFKSFVKKNIVDYWQTLLRVEASLLSSLQYFKPELYSLTKAHYMWTTAASNPFECSKSTILARMASGRYRTEMLCRHWSTNRAGHCRAPSCQQIPGTLEHLLVVCPALDTVRERLYQMWLEKSVMFPTLHSIIREVLKSNENFKVQFIIEPLAFPQLATMSKLHGPKFIEQISYITRTFAFYIHREYQKILKIIKNDPIPSDNTMSIISNPVIFAVDPVSHPSADVLHLQAVQHNSGDEQCLTDQYMPSDISRASPNLVGPTIPSPVHTNTHNDCTPAQTCVTDVQQSSSDSAVQLVSQYQSVPSQSHGQVPGSNSGGGEHHCLGALQLSSSHPSTHHHPCSGTL